MEIGSPHTIYTPQGELVFNDFSSSRAALGGGTAIPSGHSGSGYLIQKISQGDGAGLRNPIDNRPHKQGAIMHRFQLLPSIYTIEGVLVANTKADREALADTLRGALYSILQTDGRHFFYPSGSATGVRFRTVRLYDMVDISDDTNGIAGPKGFTITLIAADPVGYTFAQDETDYTSGQTKAIPNDGNYQTWPVVRVDGPVSAGSVSVVNPVTGFAVVLDPLTVANGHYAEIDMLDETVYLDGDSTNLLPSVVLADSDFFSIPEGGGSITINGTTGKVLSNDAWI